MKEELYFTYHVVEDGTKMELYVADTDGNEIDKYKDKRVYIVWDDPLLVIRNSVAGIPKNLEMYISPNVRQEIINWDQRVTDPLEKLFYPPERTGITEALTQAEYYAEREMLDLIGYTARRVVDTSNVMTRYDIFDPAVLMDANSEEEDWVHNVRELFIYNIKKSLHKEGNKND